MKPHRRFEVEIHVSGDAWDDVVHVLCDLLPHVEDHGPDCSSVSGGCSSGHYVHVTEDPEQTPARYSEELEAYIKQLRPTPPAPNATEETKGEP